MYEEAYKAYFAAFDTLEQTLSKSTWLCGEAVSETDLYRPAYPYNFRSAM